MLQYTDDILTEISKMISVIIFSCVFQESTSYLIEHSLLPPFIRYNGIHPVAVAYTFWFIYPV